MSGLALASERRLGVRRSPLVYPALEVVRELVVAALWVVPFLSSSVHWRGRRLQIGERTRLRPAETDVSCWHVDEDLPVEEVVARALTG